MFMGACFMYLAWLVMDRVWGDRRNVVIWGSSVV
jgi:hypothetical protein